MKFFRRTNEGSQTLPQDKFDETCGKLVSRAILARQYQGNQIRWREGLSQYVTQELSPFGDKVCECKIDGCGVDQERVTISSQGLEPFVAVLDMSGPSPYRVA